MVLFLFSLELKTRATTLLPDVHNTFVVFVDRILTATDVALNRFSTTTICRRGLTVSFITRTLSVRRRR